MSTLVLLRHGQSAWNLENRFTGWWDVDLTSQGEAEATSAGRLLADDGVMPDVVHTSVLTRAVRTASLALEAAGRAWVPVRRHWRLNERHYGALQGLNKSETAAQHGEAQVKIWRRAYDIAPPPLEKTDPRYPGHDPRYAGLSAEQLPQTECLKDTVARFLPFWHETLAPAVKSGQRVLVAAHGNSIRAMVKYVDNVSDDAIVELNIPTGVPLVYELDADLKPIKHYYLGNAEEIAKAMASVANQGKAKG